MKVVARVLTIAVPVAGMLLGSSGVASAANPSGTGQPDASCQDFQPTPTSPLLVKGFNTAGFAHAGTVYAGSDGTASALHAQSPNAVSQYDVACYQQSLRGVR